MHASSTRLPPRNPGNVVAPSWSYHCQHFKHGLSSMLNAPWFPLFLNNGKTGMAALTTHDSGCVDLFAGRLGNLLYWELVNVPDPQCWETRDPSQICSSAASLFVKQKVSSNVLKEHFNVLLCEMESISKSIGVVMWRWKGNSEIIEHIKSQCCSEHIFLYVCF